MRPFGPPTRPLGGRVLRARTARRVAATPPSGARLSGAGLSAATFLDGLFLLTFLVRPYQKGVQQSCRQQLCLRCVRSCDDIGAFGHPLRLSELRCKTYAANNTLQATGHRPFRKCCKALGVNANYNPLATPGFRYIFFLFKKQHTSSIFCSVGLLC